MAMDKEMLLQRLQSQYLTRQEVLFKLPLNISIDSFWPELVERRRLRGVVLPLHREDGKPLWYVLTDKMIAASEKLCAMALDCDSVIDPYQAEMTSAMTEEIFFTSFVEGAQINLQEAMDFLERGAEPENVQEQLIQNNRNAWMDMLRTLYYPMDDRFVRMLAYRLTDEMEGHATDLRQTDAHTIAAMGNEGYGVPPASVLPALMQEYSAFLASTEVHPLIKAAVGQAFVLITRPFPDGNERLSRMISYAVLLRSGYDFFRDISISSIIARENYRYFKSMQDIIRSENGGDLTYFVEYYLDLLARSVDVKAEQEQRRQQEALMKERQAATQPLTREPAPQATRIALASDGTQERPAPSREEEDSGKKAESREADDKAAEEETIKGSTQEHLPTESPPGRLYTINEYLGMVRDAGQHHMGKVQKRRKERVVSKLIELARNGPHTFCRVDWERLTGITVSVSRDDLSLMHKLGLIFCENVSCVREARRYYLPLASTADQPRDTPNPDQEALRAAIQGMLKSEYVRERQMATSLLDMLENGMHAFTFADWISRNPVPNKDVGFSILRIALNYGFLEFDDGTYRFTQALKSGPKCYHMPEKQRDVLLRLMEAFPDEKFTVRNAAEFTGIKYSTISYYLDNFMQRGILKVEKAPTNVNVYEFSSEVHGIFESIGRDGETGSYRAMPERTKEIHDRLHGMEEAG